MQYGSSIGISVIIPVHNSARYLRDCLDSAASQTHAHLEVIVVDDGSADESASICEEYAAKHSNFKLLRQPCKGPSAARNLGLSQASAEWIAFVDSDDIIHPYLTQALAEIRLYSKAEIISTRLIRGKTPNWDMGRKPVTTFTPEEAIIDLLYQRKISSSVCGKLFHKSVFKHAKFDESTRYEDLEIMPRLIMASKQVAYSPIKGYFYRQHKHSFTALFSPQRIDVLNVTKEIKTKYSPNPQLYLASLDRYFAACFNMLILCSRAEHPKANKCWEEVQRLHTTILANPKSRLKNRLGAAIVPLGKKACLAAVKLLY